MAVKDTEISNREKREGGENMNIHIGQQIAVTERCLECLRVFDLMNEKDANEFHYGHDCEPKPWPKW